MAGRVDKIQLIILTIRRLIVERDRIALDRNAPFPLNIHRVEHLVMKLAQRHAATGLDQSIRQGQLAMIDVGNDAEIPDVSHALDALGQCAGLRFSRHPSE